MIPFPNPKLQQLAKDRKGAFSVIYVTMPMIEYVG
jgi:hypothetical protein